MLQNIRDRAQGWIAYLIILLISIPFALWGINEYFSPDSEIYVAQVDGQKLTMRQLNRLYQQRMERLRAQFGNTFRADMFDEKVVRRAVLDGLVEQTVVMTALQRVGYAIGNSQLLQRIHTTQEFQQNGQFSQPLYERLVSSIGNSTTGYESEERGRMVLQQFRVGIVASALPDNGEAERIIRLREQQREVSYLQVAAEAFKDEITIDDAAITAHYDAEHSRYMEPERGEFSYVELKAEALRGSIEIDEATLEAAYQEQRAQFLSQEQRRASHILILVEGEGEAADAAARSRAEELLAKIRDGESFAELAKANSEDPLSATKGGDLGFVERGMMDGDFEEALYALAEGEVSEPVRSSFGYHLIKLEQIDAPKQKPFAEVRDELHTTLTRERAEKLFYEQAEELANLTFENPESLEPVAEALGLEIKSSGWMNRSGGGTLPADPKIITAAFSNEVLNDRINSSVIELAADHLLVLRLKEYRAPEQKPLDVVREEITATLRQAALREHAAGQASTLLQRLEAGETVDALAAERGVTLQRVGAIGRTEREQPAEIVRQAFKLPHPLAGGASYGNVELANGDRALVVVTAVHDGDPAAPKGGPLSGIAQQLQRQRGEQQLDAIVAELRSGSKIRFIEENLEQ